MLISKAEMKNLMNMKVSDLKSELKKRGFKGYSKMKKPELQDALLDLLDKECLDKEEPKTDKEEEIAELKAEIENLKAWNKDLQECINDDVSSFYATRTDDYIDKMFEEHDKHIREFAEEAQRLAIGIAEDGFFIPVKGNENKIKKWFKDSAKMYHPDKPTGDTEMMMFINDLREINKNF